MYQLLMVHIHFQLKKIKTKTIQENKLLCLLFPPRSTTVEQIDTFYRLFNIQRQFWLQESNPEANFIQLINSHPIAKGIHFQTQSPGVTLKISKRAIEQERVKVLNS